MLDSGAICPSKSAWCCVVVLVQKKGGGLCFCIDFCHLNTHMKKHSYPLLRIQETLESLVGAGDFSCLDLKSGFWHIQMDESSKQYTAFTLGNYTQLYSLIYLDNIVVFSQTTEEHLHYLCIVFDQFREHNLKLKPLECSIFREEITYLAHPVSKDGVQPNNVNLKAIAECASPQTYMEVHVFLGLVGHYRRFIKGFAWVAQPLSKHLAGEGASRKSEWVLLSEDALKAFEALKQACITAPILAFVDYTKCCVRQMGTYYAYCVLACVIVYISCIFFSSLLSRGYQYIFYSYINNFSFHYV